MLQFLYTFVQEECTYVPYLHTYSFYGLVVVIALFEQRSSLILFFLLPLFSVLLVLRTSRTSSVVLCSFTQCRSQFRDGSRKIIFEGAGSHTYA